MTFAILMVWYGSNKLTDTLSPIVLDSFIKSKNISSLLMIFIFFSKMSELSYNFRCVGFFFLSPAPNCYQFAANNSIKMQNIFSEVVVFHSVVLL